jgi:hypothetical protein
MIKKTGRQAQTMVAKRAIKWLYFLTAKNEKGEGLSEKS